MMEGTRIVFAEPRVLKGVRVIDLVHVREEEPEVMKGFVRNELELGKVVPVGDGLPKVSNEGLVGCLGREGRLYRSSGVVEAGWHC
jgi:hypothetical protein